MMQKDKWREISNLTLMYYTRVSFSTTDRASLCIAAGCWTEQSRVLCADKSVLDLKCFDSTEPLICWERSPACFLFFLPVFLSFLFLKFYIYTFCSDTLMRKAQIPHNVIIRYIYSLQAKSSNPIPLKPLLELWPAQYGDLAVIDNWVASSNFLINTDSSLSPHLFSYQIQ